MGSIVDVVIANVKEKNGEASLFAQAVEEVLESVEPILKKRPDLVDSYVLPLLVEPERIISFRVPWVDDEGVTHVNTGYRCQFNSAIGPYKGGLRFSPEVSVDEVKFLAFEQTFKNALTGLPIGGAKGGADFDPIGKSDMEIMRFCQSFMNELYRHIGPVTDVPAGDIGVGKREIGYMYGQYKKLTNRVEGTLTGKSPVDGGLVGREEATGYGVVFFAREMLAYHQDDLTAKEVVLSGYGNVAWGAAKKLNELGAKVITISGLEGFIHDPEGISGEKVDFMREIRYGDKTLADFVEKFPSATFYPNEQPWHVSGDIYMPCATQNEIGQIEAEAIAKSRGQYIVEGSNMPLTREATHILKVAGKMIAPFKAANAGGVACSVYEMAQNASFIPTAEAQVYAQLEILMKNIHQTCVEVCEAYQLPYDLNVGANLAAFERVAEAMLAQGIV